MDTTFHDNCSSAVNPLPFFNLIQPPVTLPLPSQGSALRAVMTSPGAVYLRDPQVCLCMWAKSIQLCPTLCDPIDGSPAGPSVHGTLQTRILEWAAMPSSRGSSQPRDQTMALTSPALAGEFFTISATWAARSQFRSVAQLCPTLCDPMDYRSPGSSLHGILQPKILECLKSPS